ncbi:MAG: hypothetical protein L3J71_06240 [Victivallaceae bacterium]|nr:hypothetical protein [Victivallaceae bacterium]
MSEMISKVGEYLSNAHSVYWFFAVIGSVVFIIQFLLTLMGFDDGGTDIDGDGDISFGEHADSGLGDFHIFSVRSIVAFVMFFGWGGILWGHHGWLGFFGALLLGIGMMVVTAFILLGMMRMQQESNIGSKDIVGCSGIVYLRIPENEQGKVTVTVAECTREIKAIADEELKKGIAVDVIKHINGRLYKVKKIES